MQTTEWILPEALSPLIEEYHYDRNGIQQWILESPNPHFEKWLTISEENVTLFASHFINNNNQVVSTSMWISSGLIKKGTVSCLVKALDDTDFAVDFINASEIAAYPETDCYISPLEVCRFDWKSEHYSE
ncbi:hypothetical protein [Hespellia stercorisuis]|uniref:hypothetical protein n=1 Tax=Hespellia stercorisuis TaxID=180311 RepID=UPI0011608F3D|nr:hypothetical protein [Hespellia stercorisuis]